MDQDKTQAKVRVFSTTYCPYCFSLKEYLKEKKVTFEDIDVGINKEALEEMISRSGQMGVPVIEINGNIVIGFDREAINRLLKA